MTYETLFCSHINKSWTRLNKVFTSWQLPKFFIGGIKWSILSLVSEASREVANLTERKNLHTPVYGVKEFVCLSICEKIVILPQKIATQTCTIGKGVWNLPHKFHLYLINFVFPCLFECFFTISFQSIPNKKPFFVSTLLIPSRKNICFLL